MDLDTRGVINNKYFSLSNYSLSIQLLFINIFIFFFGIIFLIFYNFYLINNDQYIDKKIDKSLVELNKITSYLEKNSIINIPLYQTNYRCRVIDKDIDVDLYKLEKCDQQNLFLNTLELSDLEIERYVVEQYILQNYSGKDLNIKIFNDSWIKIADSQNIYLTEDVSETDIEENNQKTTNLYNLYEENYLFFFNSVYSKILRENYEKISNNKTHEINIVSETIRYKSITEKLFIDEDDELIKIFSSPIILDQKIYGVVLLSFKLITNNNELALSSINLLNFFIIFLLIIFILSFFFLRGLVIPLNQLTRITVLEREKIRNSKKLDYPIRSDEIGILAKHIQIMSNDLKLQMQQLEKFTTDVAHELKNPLTAIKSSSELLLKDTISEENKIKLIKNFNKEVDRMNRLISDISNFSRTMSEIEIEKFKLIELNKFLETYINNYSGNSKNINLKFLPNKNNLNILVNEDKLLQVIINLVENSISIANKNTSILLTTNKNLKNKKAEIRVYDQGKGVKFEDKEKIFSRFYTDRDKFREKHSGLGLSISKEVIKSFNGTIELTKSDKIDFRGACFIIKLPLRTI
ncbi:HAMP domain-containing histidine kinase [Pelagibacteraceae bacterium]|nr:HAMP domain-containing histidine kinase [Pelagibacteraceae bacterium]